MNILVHTIFYRPDLVGVAPYTADLCEWLAARGHQVEVVCPPPYYPEWRVRAPYRAGAYASETLDGVYVSRCPIFVPARPRGLWRLAYAASFALSSAWPLLRRMAHPPEVIFVIEPSFLNALPSLAAARLYGARAWLHVQDFELDLAFDMGQFRSGAARRVLEMAERWILRRFDAVSTISATMRDRLLAKGVCGERALLFPNWVDTGVIAPGRTSSYRAELRLNGDTVVVLFSGSMGDKQALDVLVDAARLLAAERGLCFVICGEGPAAALVREATAPLPNVRLLPLQPAGRLPDLLILAGIHVLTQRASASDRLLPSKLLGMLASGRPVVATVAPETELGRIVASCGVIVEPENPRALADALLALARDPDRRTELGRRAREYAVHCCDRAPILEQFERELEARAC